MSVMSVEREIIYYDCVRHINVGVSKLSFVDFHMHDSFELNCILEGSGFFHQGNQTVEVGPGDLLLSNPNEMHSYSTLPDQPITMLTIQVNVRFLRRYIEFIPKMFFKSSQIMELSQTDCDAIKRHLFRTAIAYLVHDDAQQFNVIGGAVLLFGKLVSLLDWVLQKDCDDADKEFSKNRARRLSDYIEENYRQRITLSMLAEMEGISTTYLSHYFRKTFGVPFQQYVSARRLEKSLILMHDKSVSMVDICMNCGFSDSRYLEAACRKMFGCSVSEYRKRLENNEGVESVQGSNAAYQRMSKKEGIEVIEKYLGAETFRELSQLYEY
jgi:AraC-like DNA-binding protein